MPSNLTETPESASVECATCVEYFCSEVRINGDSGSIILAGKLGRCTSHLRHGFCIAV